ncbi:MAG: DUF2326 domain-containing protein [Thomasclavelia ramosa]|uniref:DUF2326 domain-containing protein n=2 Tax=Thomasclavelia ramosa TaxID=1547 RepID=UPI00398430D1
MKLVKMEIIDQNDNLVREIDLKNQYYMIGEVEQSIDKKTSNALGKTAFLQMVSYCLCGNIIDELKKLQNYKLKLNVIKDTKETEIIRVIGSTIVSIDGYEYPLDLAKEKLNINRSIIHHQIHLDERKNIILDKPNRFELYQAAFSILGLSDELIKSSADFYNTSNKIVSLSSRKKDLLSKIKNNDDKIIINKQLEEIDAQLNRINELDEKEIEIQNENFLKLRESLKRKKDLLLFNKNENMHRINIISDYIHSLENVPKETLSFIKRADKELADVISLKMDKAIEYHKLFSVERTKMLFNEKKQLEEEINDFDKELFDIDRRLPSISETLKNTNEIKKLFSIQNQLFDKRKALMLANQSVLEVDNINREIELLKQNKTVLREELLNQNMEETKKQFIDYSNDLVKKLYPEFFTSFFDINIIDYNKINTAKIPINFNFRINKDHSEGVRNVRNIIVDLIMLKYSKNIEFMAWDSSTFNGIDPNQLKILFEEMIKISREQNKQVIISFNSFQLGKYYEKMFNDDVIPSANKLILTHNSTLLNIEF